MTSSKFDHTRAFMRLVADTNINQQTLLATDYLNHFNEIIMLIEMIPDLPEILDEAKAWMPKSYREHFRDSGFSDRELAIEAYEHAPEKYKVPFEQVIEALNRSIEAGLHRIERAVEAQDAEPVKEKTRTVTRGLQRLIDRAGAIINGDDTTLHQSDIDRLMDE